MIQCNLLKTSQQSNDQLGGRNFKIDAPTYVWDLPRNITLHFPELHLTALFANMYITNCSQAEHSSLLDRTHYLRFCIFQDAQESRPYVTSYLREIRGGKYPPPQYHSLVLETCPTTCVPMEINLATYGLFMWVDKTAWINKQIGLEHVEEVVE